MDSEGEEVTKAVLSGDVYLKNEALTQVGKQNPFLSLGRLGVEIKEADLLHRTLTVASVAIEGLDLEGRRDAQGVIDLVEMFKPPAKSGSPGPSPGAAPGPAAGAAPPPKRKIFPCSRRSREASSRSRSSGSPWRRAWLASPTRR